MARSELNPPYSVWRSGYDERFYIIDGDRTAILMEVGHVPEKRTIHERSAAMEAVADALNANPLAAPIEPPAARAFIDRDQNPGETEAEWIRRELNS